MPRLVPYCYKTDNVKLIFEVEDLRNASPATVSRAGIIYVSESDLDWEPVLKSWILRKSVNIGQLFEACVRKYVGSCSGYITIDGDFTILKRLLKMTLSTSLTSIPIQDRNHTGTYSISFKSIALLSLNIQELAILKDAADYWMVYSIYLI
jgi:hypothetical protein